MNNPTKLVGYYSRVEFLINCFIFNPLEGF